MRPAPPEHRLRVLFVSPRLVVGGAERTLINIANHLDRSRFEPSFLLLADGGSFASLLRPDIEVTSFGHTRARRAILDIARHLRRARPDVVLSTLRYVNASTVIGGVLSRARVPVIVRETNHHTAAGISSKSVRERITAWTYRKAARVVALSNGVRDDVIHRYHVPPDHVVTIYNPIDLQFIRAAAGEQATSLRDLSGNGNEEFHVVGAGRLTRQKGFDLLIRAAAELPDVPLRVWIAGEGDERASLEALARQLGVSDRVSLLGYQANPYALMAAADLFVLPSRWEGFGHVIAEAMACGTPVLAARCPAGPDEIITDGVDGALIQPDSVSALAAGLRKLYKRPDLRTQYAFRARTSVQRFDCPVIVKHYENLMQEIGAA